MVAIWLHPQQGPVPTPPAIDRQIPLCQRYFIVQGGRVTQLNQSVPKQITQILQQSFRLSWFCPHERNGTVERIEQKMRAYARLQFRQTRGGIRRHAAFGPHHQTRHQYC